MDSTNVPALLGSVVTPISDILVNNLPLILGILAALIGLGFLINRVIKWIHPSYRYEITSNGLKGFGSPTSFRRIK